MPADKITSRTQTTHDNTNSDSVRQALRQRAGKRMSSNSNLAIDAIEAMSAHDVQRLFHELQVHQVELEMQNDELH